VSIQDLLNSTSGRSFKFAAPGATVTGTIVSASVVQKRDFDTNEPEVWADGQPVQQVKVSLQTTLDEGPNPDDDPDDGIRNVYIKGWGDQLRALRAAIKAAGAGDLEPGGTFSVTYIGDGELAKGKRGQPPKIYSYRYIRPSGVAGILNGDQEPAAHHVPIPAQQAAASRPQPAVPDGMPQLTPEQMAALLAYQAKLAEQAAAQQNA
jgi:hypothetical protein